MSMVVLFVSAFIIGLSGAMMPGPLLTYVINGGLRKGFIAGPLVIVGHAILEFLLVILLLLGLNDLFANQIFTSVVGIIGGSVLLWMGSDMLINAIKKRISIEDEVKRKKVSGFILPGALISISNPYWILWWATVGITYLVNAHQQGIIGISVFFTGHIFADFAWYSIVSGIVSFGRKVINDRIYRSLILTCGVILIYFAGTFIFKGLKFFIKI